MKFTVHTSVEDHLLLKVSLVASFAGAELVINKLPKHQLALLDPSVSSSILLDTASGFLSQHVQILRFIVASTTNSLSGSEEQERERIEHWLDFAWQELDVPFHAILGTAYRSKVFAHNENVAATAKVDFNKNLTVLEEYMSSRTFFVGEKITLADISIFAIYLAALQKSIFACDTYPSLLRWFMTVGSDPHVIAVLGNVIDVIASGSLRRVNSSVKAGAKWDRHRIRVKELLKEGTSAIGKTVTVKGWVRTARGAEKGASLFVELTDGSTVKGIQLLLNITTTKNFQSVANSGGSGASLAIEGTVVASPAKGQTIEIHVTTATVLGAVYGGDKGEIGAKNYPMAKKAHSVEYLREKAHLRPRSKVFSSAMRMRNAMAFATHKFFNERGFIYTHTPIVTAADCEGAGEQFVITSLLPEEAKVAGIPVDKKGHVDFSKDFFGRRCCLTVSGQLNVETHACALSDVYTFGPTFRAENSHTARHLAEFWMIEPEICFADLADDMALAEDYVRFCTAYALEHCADDIHYFEHEYPQGEKGLQQRLQNVVDNEFARITYTEAIDLLQSEIALGRVEFAAYPSWGDDLGSEHERYICEKVYQKPTVVINYPKGIKAFYMKLNDDQQTVAAMDILVPKIGELIGGSQREDDLATLERRCVESGMKPSDIWWYADLRRYGTVPHAGFGLGFERLIMFVTGLENIRDVIPFPRVPGHAEF